MRSLIVVLFSLLVLPWLPSAHAEDGGVGAKPTALVVFVFDKSCKISCGIVQPIIRELQTEYSGRVDFVELDVSKDSIKDSQKTAKSLGVSSFLSDTEDWYPAVGMFTSRRKMVKQILGAKSKDVYKTAIEKALASK
jgi:hypothetical protein